MRPVTRKSKMVSFRISPEEYQTVHEACLVQGLPSISDLARSALRKLIVDNAKPSALSDEIRELKDRIKLLSLEVERVSQRVGDGGTPNDKMTHGQRQ
jgi:hypothetical protein